MSNIRNVRVHRIKTCRRGIGITHIARQYQAVNVEQPQVTPIASVVFLPVHNDRIRRGGFIGMEAAISDVREALLFIHDQRIHET